MFFLLFTMLHAISSIHFFSNEPLFVLIQEYLINFLIPSEPYLSTHVRKECGSDGSGSSGAPERFAVPLSDACGDKAGAGIDEPECENERFFETRISLDARY